MGLALWVPPRNLAAPDSSAAPLLLLRPDANGWVEYALGAYAADEHQENVVEPGETNRRLPEVPGAEQYGVASARILLRPPRRTADVFWQELAADLQSIAQPPRVTRLSSQAATYASLLPVDTLQPGAPKNYHSALDLMIRRVRTLTEQSEGKLWFSSDPEGKPVFKDRSWGEGYLVAMLWDGFRTSGDPWYRAAALAANQLMLGGEEREFHATGLNYWNASVCSYRETADPQWRASRLKSADMMARIADPVTGLIPEYGPTQRKKPEDPYHRSNYEQFGRRIVDSLIDRYLTPVGRDDRRPPGMLAHACYTKPEEGEFIWGSYSLLRALRWLHGKDAKRAP